MLGWQTQARSNGAHVLAGQRLAHIEILHHIERPVVLKGFFLGLSRTVTGPDKCPPDPLGFLSKYHASPIVHHSDYSKPLHSSSSRCILNKRFCCDTIEA